nr:hypothetical protein [Tanacetum cinerariifolium]
MDLLAFIWTADPTKVRVTERQHAEDEPRVLESTVGHVDVQPVAVTTHTIVEDVAPLQPRRQKKRKTAVTDAGGPSHPPKKLREDFRALAATRALVAPSLFCVDSSSTGRSDSVPGGFSDVSGSDFLVGGIRTIVDPDSDLQKISLNAEVRMRAEYNIRKKRKLRAAVDEQAELLKTKDGEIECLKAQLLLKEADSSKAIRLRAE